MTMPYKPDAPSSAPQLPASESFALTPREVLDIREARDFLCELADLLSQANGLEALHLSRKLGAIARRFEVRGL